MYGVLQMRTTTSGIKSNKTIAARNRSVELEMASWQRENGTVIMIRVVNRRIKRARLLNFQGGLNHLA